MTVLLGVCNQIGLVSIEFLYQFVMYCESHSTYDNLLFFEMILMQ